MTGNSVIGDIRSDVTDIRSNQKDIKKNVSDIQVDLKEIKAALACASSGQGSVSAGLPVAPIPAMLFESLQQQLTSIQEDIIGVKRKLDRDFADVVAASSGRAETSVRRCVPVFYLSNTFKLHSCTPFVLLTRWVTPEPPAPAWRHIRNEMLPRIEGRRAQECLLTTYNSFMQAFLGRNPNVADVETNLQGFFHVAWARMATEYGWPEDSRSSARTVKTVYGWMLQRPAVMQKLKDSKLIVPSAFQIQAAIRARDARELARFNASQVPHTTIHHHAPCSLQCSFRCRLHRASKKCLQ